MSGFAQGIISAIAGGMDGGGKAWQTQARDEADAARKQRMVELTSKMEMDRQAAVEAIRAKNQEASDVRQHQNALERQDKQQQGVIAREVADQSWRSTEAQKDRDARAQESAEDRKNRLDAARMSAGARKDPTVTSGDGRIGTIQNGQFVPYIDSNGEPLKGPKDTSQGTVALANILVKEAEAEMNPEKKAAKFEQATRLLSGGKVDPQSKTYPQPPSGAVSALRKDPKLVGDFDAKYGPGAAERALSDALKSGQSANAITGKTTGGPGSQAGNNIPKPDFAREPDLSPDEKAMQSDWDARRSRIDAAERRAQEIRAITTDDIEGMTAEQAQAMMDRYGMELSAKQRIALKARLR